MGKRLWLGVGAAVAAGALASVAFAVTGANTITTIAGTERVPRLRRRRRTGEESALRRPQRDRVGPPRQPLHRRHRGLAHSQGEPAQGRSRRSPATAGRDPRETAAPRRRRVVGPSASPSMRPATCTSPTATATACARSLPREGSRPSPASAGSRALRVTADLRQLRSSLSPRGVAVDGSGNVYIADVENHRVRKVSPRRDDQHVRRRSARRDSRATAGRRAPRAWPARSTSRQTGPGTSTSLTPSNYRVRRSVPEGTITTFAGRAAGHRSCSPSGSAESSTSAAPCVCERSPPPVRSPRSLATAARLLRRRGPGREGAHGRRRRPGRGRAREPVHRRRREPPHPQGLAQ